MSVRVTFEERKSMSRTAFLVLNTDFDTNFTHLQS